MLEMMKTDSGLWLQPAVSFHRSQNKAAPIRWANTIIKSGKRKQEIRNKANSCQQMFETKQTPATQTENTRVVIIRCNRKGNSQVRMGGRA
jgi:hypothetical protein